MVAWALNGDGSIVFTPGTTYLQLDITTVPGGSKFGNAIPTNYYHIGLIRFTDGSSYGPPIPILGGPERLDLPTWATGLSYSLHPDAVVTTTENLPGTGPPASGVTFFRYFTPGNIYTTSVDTNVGLRFHMNTADTLVQYLWYRPGSDTGPTSRTVTLYDLSGTALWSGATSAEASGWNSYNTGGVSLTAAADYVLAYTVAAGETRAQMTSMITDPFLTPGAQTVETRWQDGTGPLFPTNTGHDFNGFDALFQ